MNFCPHENQNQPAKVQVKYRPNQHAPTVAQTETASQEFVSREKKYSEKLVCNIPTLRLCVREGPNGMRRVPSINFSAFSRFDYQ